MAGVLVYIEREGDRPRRASVEALGEGRRIASELGASLWAFAPGWPAVQADEIAGLLGGSGADRVVTLPEPSLDQTLATWSPQGVTLADLARRLPARLVLAADTVTARDLMPRVAARLRAAFMPRAAIERGPEGQLIFTRALYRGRYVHRLADDDIDHSIVTTVCSGRYSVASGDPAGAQQLEMGPPAGSDRSAGAAVTRERDGDLETAPIVITAGGGADQRAWELVKTVANALGAAYAATRSLCERGIAPPTREVGLGGRSVSPRLYIACAASGSEEHLGAVAPGAKIVAINSDPEAPIFQVASHGWVADIGDALPELQAQLAAAKEKATAR